MNGFIHIGKYQSILESSAKEYGVRVLDQDVYTNNVGIDVVTAWCCRGDLENMMSVDVQKKPGETRSFSEFEYYVRWELDQRFGPF